MVKPGSDGKVVAKKVHTLIPNFSALSLNMMTLYNEDVGALEENLPCKLNGPLHS
jgi:hypothetical protein